LQREFKALTGLDGFVSFANARGYKFSAGAQITDANLELAVGGVGTGDGGPLAWNAIKSALFGVDASFF
jgi:hypothetical protein